MLEAQKRPLLALALGLTASSIRSGNGAEFTAHAVRAWLGRIGVKTLCIEPGSHRENGYNENVNGKLRD